VAATFVIAHRLSTIRSADQILVLEGGDCGKGSHEQLLAKDGRYKQLYDKQYASKAEPVHQSRRRLYGGCETV
jgi:ABC-type multidrug transport system fused ATPase/permease subunit